jgi:hypothetical protein
MVVRGSVLSEKCRCLQNKSALHRAERYHADSRGVRLRTHLEIVCMHVENDAKTKHMLGQAVSCQNLAPPMPIRPKLIFCCNKF